MARKRGSKGTEGAARTEDMDSTGSPFNAVERVTSEDVTSLPLGKPKWTGRVGRFILFLFVVSALVGVGIWRHTAQQEKHGARSVKIEQLYPPVDFSGTTVVKDTTFVWMPQRPFFQTAPVTLQPGDEVEIIPAGSYGFDRFYRGMGNDDTVMLPGSYPKTPNQRGGIKKVKEFPLKDEPMGGILCGFGKVVYDENHVPHLENGSQLIFCGRGAIVRVPDVPDPEMQLTLNERWFAYSWDDNCGKIYIRVIVHRKTS